MPWITTLLIITLRFFADASPLLFRFRCLLLMLFIFLLLPLMPLPPLPLWWYFLITMLFFRLSSSSFFTADDAAAYIIFDTLMLISPPCRHAMRRCRLCLPCCHVRLALIFFRCCWFSMLIDFLLISMLMVAFHFFAFAFLDFHWCHAAAWCFAFVIFLSDYFHYAADTLMLPLFSIFLSRHWW